MLAEDTSDSTMHYSAPSCIPLIIIATPLSCVDYLKANFILSTQDQPEIYKVSQCDIESGNTNTYRRLYISFQLLLITRYRGENPKYVDHPQTQPTSRADGDLGSLTKIDVELITVNVG